MSERDRFTLKLANRAPVAHAMPRGGSTGRVIYVRARERVRDIRVGRDGDEKARRPLRRESNAPTTPTRSEHARTRRET